MLDRKQMDIITAIAEAFYILAEILWRTMLAYMAFSIGVICAAVAFILLILHWINHRE